MPQPDLTTISEFRHSNIDSRVAIVGNHHVGSVPYMEALRKELEKYEAAGSVIHYEGTRDARPEELQQESQRVRSVHQKLVDIQQIFSDEVTATSPGNIDSVINPKKDVWENHDASILELAKFISRRPVQYLSLSTYTHVLDVLADEPRDRRHKLYHEMGYVAGVVAFEFGLHSSFVTYRNSIALKAVDASIKQVPDRDVTLLWGHGHVAGLARGLIGRGFVRTSITAYNSKES